MAIPSRGMTSWYDALNLVEPCLRADFIKFIETGETSEELAAARDRDAPCQEAVDLMLRTKELEQLLAAVIPANCRYLTDVHFHDLVVDIDPEYIPGFMEFVAEGELRDAFVQAFARRPDWQRLAEKAFQRMAEASFRRP